MMLRAGEPVANPRTRLWAVAGLACVLLSGAWPTMAQFPVEPTAGELSGVLKRIKDSGVVRIGYRIGAVPFSFAGPNGNPHGYSIDICQAIVEDLAEAVGSVHLRVEYRPVTPSDRIDQVVEGRVDLECGTTSSTAQRRELVAFSPLMFVAGTRLLVKRGSNVRSERNLPGRKVVVVRGTTNAAAIRRLASDRGREFDVQSVDDFAQAVERLDTGAADALAADDVLIAGFLADSKRRGSYAMVGRLLSYEPYGIMFAKADAPLRQVVDSTFRRLARTREIRWIYDKWFLRTLPSGSRLGLPMGTELQRAFQVLGLPAD
jgi:glutamate/aspartate transport system substrate-binding protein